MAMDMMVATYLCTTSISLKMNIKSQLAKPFADYIYKNIQRSMRTALDDQQKILQNLLKKGQSTRFGKDHLLNQVHDHTSYKQAVPVQDYEQLKSYIQDIKEGKPNILWPGKPIYLAKTSGTTSGAKYIPITKEIGRAHV